MLIREKIIKYSEKSSDYELLTVLFSRKIATILIEKYSSIDGLRENKIEELEKIKGIGKSSIAKLKALLEFADRFQKGKILNLPKINFSTAVSKHYTWLTNSKQEHFYVLFLNCQFEIIGEKLISLGSLDIAIVNPREVFKEAIVKSAKAIILVHNHPSGYSTPGKEDINLTEKMVRVGELVGIRVVDHVIVAKKGYYSFQEEGRIG